MLVVPSRFVGDPVTEAPVSFVRSSNRFCLPKFHLWSHKYQRSGKGNGYNKDGGTESLGINRRVRSGVAG